MKKKWICFVIILAAILICGGIFAWWYISTKTTRDLPLEEEVQSEKGSMEIDGTPDIAGGPYMSETPENEPPAVGLETSNGEIVACTFATLGTYCWNYEDENGQMQGICVDCSSPSEWQQIATIKMEDTEGKIKLYISDEVLNYSVCYWIENATCGVADPVAMEGDTILLEDDLDKGIYEIYVEYENGTAYYGFKVE